MHTRSGAASFSPGSFAEFITYQPSCSRGDPSSRACSHKHDCDTLGGILYVRFALSSNLVSLRHESDNARVIDRNAARQTSESRKRACESSCLQAKERTASVDVRKGCTNATDTGDKISKSGDFSRRTICLSPYCAGLESAALRLQRARGTIS